MALKRMKAESALIGETEPATSSLPLIFHRLCEEPPSAVALLELDEELAFHGVVSMRVLLGSVWVNGFCLKPQHGSSEIHSPTIGSCLTLVADDLPVSASLPDDAAIDIPTCKGKAQKKRKKKKFVLDTVLPVDCDRDRICQIIEDSGKDWMALGAVVLLQRQESFLIEFITGIAKQFSDLYGRADNTDEGAVATGIPRFHPIVPRTLPCLSIPSEWQQSVAGILQYCMNSRTTACATPVISVCGAKNSGKSTYARFLGNTLLNKFPRVAFLETDVGQTEFTAPGLVSLNLIEDPIIGLGILLLADVLRIVRPTHIVQLQLTGTTKNAPPFDADFLRSAPGWRQDSDVQSHWPEIGSSYPVVHVLDSCVPVIGVDRAPDQRLLALLAGLSPLFNREQLSMFSDRRDSKRHLCSVAGPLSTCLPYKVSWKSVAVCILHERVPRNELLYSLNGSIVGLGLQAVTEETEAKSLHCLVEDSLSQCIGLGIIRAIDAESGIFYVSTSLPASQLQFVNALMKGSLEIPLCLILQGTGRPGNFPYLSREFRSLVPGSSVRKNRQQLRRRSSGATGSYVCPQEEAGQSRN